MIIKYLLNNHYPVHTYKKDAVIYVPGALPKAVYFIKSGEVRMVTVNDDGKEFIQGIFKANQYFGEPALLVNKPYLAYTIVTRDAEIIVVNKTDFFKMIEEDRGFSMELIRTLSNRLFYKSMMLEELANEQAEHRIRTLISYLLRNLAEAEVLDITRQQLADMSGLRVETVIRLVKKLAAQKELKLIKGKIVKTGI
ncbi:MULTISPECIES: Crp/Fnr family transcriptional regulator [Pedobacter]|uniref:Cyclic nucleotide-binding n=1 Tax=Pedobacter heparinus (strain ATCC 13125 / DSM 2366 / CIP 104194 / JCM 7457 / NBRC 12017 / NCIMB 9290 / NRRL B-14731 / HIM 762-3) TaxID=485917 RepID=C6XVJ1_PEDHD|nr:MULTISPECIES: Crp/Fnr family transcriptional regulator [Pedobacter]ACU04057.1 cyclic nucleotide-binding [Pedobacter heparinus DSM 2366]MBB5436490.1 CRP-like cAMP-binding protein [Pedobacter sp. AK017]